MSGHGGDVVQGFYPRADSLLPQIGTITSQTTSGTSLAWSSISLDRVSKSIVMTEYTAGG